MKIKSLKTVDFMGLSGTYEFKFSSLEALIGKNGIGKTTILNAIRFALTGLEPDGCDIINKQAPGTAVTIELGDGNLYTREKYRNSPSKARVNGKATTISTMNERIEDVIGINLGAIKIVSSDEVIKKMKPQEMGDFILSYIPEECETAEIIGYIPDISEGMVDTIENTLPYGKFGMNAIDEALEFFRTQRKSVKEEIEVKKAFVKEAPNTAPTDSREVLEGKLQEIIASEQLYRVEYAKKKAYDTAVANQKKYDHQMKELEESIAKITAEKQPDEVRKALVAEKDEIVKSIENAKQVFNSLSTTAKQLKVNLDNLNMPYCPLSDKIKCTVDKTAIRTELEDSIKTACDGMRIQQEEYRKLEKRRKDVQEKIDAFDSNARLTDKKDLYIKQLERMKESYPMLPEKPQNMDPVAVDENKSLVQKKLNEISTWEKACEAKKAMKDLQEQYDDYDALVKAFDSKGIVKKAIIEKYMSMFEKTCNVRANEIKSGMTLKFVNEGGVRILCNTGKGSFLTYNELSGGEKAYMLYIIMDMLNTLSGAKFMLLDELAVLDAETFDALLGIIKKNTELYDHVLIATVDHEDSLNTVKKLGIKIVDIDKCKTDR